MAGQIIILAGHVQTMSLQMVSFQLAKSKETKSFNVLWYTNITIPA